MKKLKGFHYDPEKLNGWKTGPPETKDPAWVITDDSRRCISHNRMLIKWSLIGTKTLMWHPKEITDDDYCQYSPPDMPEGIEFVYE